MAHPAVGRTLRCFPADFGDSFAKAVRLGTATGPGAAGYYVGTIIAVDARLRKPVHLELRELDPVENYHWTMAKVRDKLLLQPGEDPWVILPGGGAPKRKQAAKPSNKRHNMPDHRAADKSMQLKVTEAGRDTEIEHLECTFEHEYQERPIEEVDKTPPYKKVRRPETWKRNQLRPARMVGTVEASCDLDILEGTAACRSAHCRKQCATVSLEHRREVRLQAKRVWAEKGQLGFNLWIEGLFDVKQPNMKTMAKHGFDQSQARIRDPLQRCRYCRLHPFAHDYPSHSFKPYRAAGSKYPTTAGSKYQGNVVQRAIGCPRYNDGVAFFAEKEATFLGKHQLMRSYYFPPPSTNCRSASVEVCRNTFLHVIGAGRCGYIVDRLAGRDRSQPLVLTESNKKGKVGRKPAYSPEIKDHLKSFPRTTSHYSRTAQQGKAKFFLDSTLTPTKLWRMWCHKNDQLFAVQADKYGWWKSLDRRAPPKLPAGVKWIDPKLPYSTYMYKLGKYDLYFGETKADTCETCDDLRREIKVAAAVGNSAVVASKERELASHQKEADSYYAARRADFERTKKDFVDWEFDPEACYGSFIGMDTQCQDAAGNLRTPRMTIGEAYYKRILATWVYGIHCGARDQHTMCFWNETIGKKGSNDIVSCEHWHHTHEATGAECLQLWFDACGGQINNWNGVKYHIHLTDEESPLWMYRRIDEKICSRGHSYSSCDAAFGRAQKAAKGIPMIETMQDWIQIYKDSNRGHPFKIHVMEQHEFRDWDSYLNQHYVGSQRKSHTGTAALLQGMHWRNYGWGPELCADGIVRLVYHPGEVWLKSNLDVDTPWDFKLDLRRGARKADLYKRVLTEDGWRGLETSELSEQIEGDLAIDNKAFDLYSGPLPICPAKYNDLRDLCAHMSESAKAYYLSLLVSDDIADNNNDDHYDDNLF